MTKIDRSRRHHRISPYTAHAPKKNRNSPWRSSQESDQYSMGTLLTNKAAVATKHQVFAQGKSPMALLWLQCRAAAQAPASTNSSQAKPMTLLFSEDKASDIANTRPKKWVRRNEFKNDAVNKGSPSHVDTEHVTIEGQGDMTKEVLKRTHHGRVGFVSGCLISNTKTGCLEGIA